MKEPKTDIKTLLSWVSEAQTAFQGWRADSWEDYEFRDGKQWSSADINKLKAKGVKALTINRIFPILNLINGHYLNNRQDVVAKGRTKQDNELGQVMSEGIHFVMSQNRGMQRAGAAFNDQITAGFGCLGVGFNDDPRKEKIKVSSLDWYSVWWDPYATPWMDKDDCRYVFTAEWADLNELTALFPEHKRAIMDQFQTLSSDTAHGEVNDEGLQIEEYKRYLSSAHWVDDERKRVRPVEMWYTQFVKRWFAVMPNGRVIDLDEITDTQQEYRLIQSAQEVVSAYVKKIRVATFLGTLLLQDVWSPYVHDEYPFVPYVGYLDRYGFPYGIPRQIKEQDMEVNKRRTMALSLISNRRVIIEKGAAENENTVYAEANRTDGYIVLKPGKKNAFEIQEMSQMAASQIELMAQSEREIQEISGANDESLGYSARVQSGVALDKRQQTTATITASLLENAKYSQKMLGERIAALIQDSWTDEKVMRITDRITGTEKFISINERIHSESGAVLKNDITQAIFDIEITARPATATVREKNSDLIFSAINKSPPEAIGPLLNLALEISDLPNKDLLLQQIRKATGVAPLNDDLPLEEREELQRAEADQKAAEEDKETAQQDETLRLENDKLAAETEKLRAEAEKAQADAGAAKQIADQKGFEIGAKAAQAAQEPETPLVKDQKSGGTKK